MSVRNFDLSEREDKALGEYLQILNPVPAPHLAAGRTRLLAEAARLEERDVQWGRLFANILPGFSFALVSLMILTVLVIGTVTLWSSTGSGNGLFGLFSTPTVAYTRAPLREASATLSSDPVELKEATPEHTVMRTTPAPVPTPQPTLTHLSTIEP